jgi:uncharacterized protein (DUF2236 family)
MFNVVKDRVSGATTALFSHGPQPLTNTLSYMGDPGLCGPDSVSWPVIGDVTAFVGGIRALLVQSAHPEVVAGVDEHSTYRTDPLGRLSRTSVYVTETTYGAAPEVDAAVATVRAAHVPVRGVSERDKPYNASTPALAAWVHNVLTESCLGAYQAYGPRSLTAEEADRFVVEQARVGALLGADPLPSTASDLSTWVRTHPELTRTKAQASAIEFLAAPPLSLPVRLGYRMLFKAAVETIPASVLDVIGLTPTRTGASVGRRGVGTLRWALGSSPSWGLALERTGATAPEAHFRRSHPSGIAPGDA